MITRTPPKITKQIITLCNEIDKSQKPYRVPVKSESWVESKECFFDVKTKVEKDGGQIQFGWTIWEWPNVLIEAEFHAIWISPENEHIDITPNLINSKRILFLPDSTRKYDYNREYYRVDNIRKPISDSPLVHDLIAFKQQIFNIEETHSPGRMCCLEGAVLKQWEELQWRVDWICHLLMSQSQPPRDYNDATCLCGSGRKFKKCCGKS